MFDVINGKSVWCGGKGDFAQAAKTAESCCRFSPDCEEECFADEDISCYNCRYRRWTRASFVCMKGGNT